MAVMLELAHITTRDASEGLPGTPVPILQRRWEFEQLLTLYRQRQPQRVLEVGTYHGGTLYYWLTNAIGGAIVISVDQPPAGVDNREHFYRWAPPLVQVRALHGDSTDPAMAAAVARFGPFDWIFIDAGHAQHEVQADWDYYRPLAADGGIIALHDILPGKGAQSWIQVDPVWRAIQRQGYATQELVADAGTDWGGIGVVYL